MSVGTATIPAPDPTAANVPSAPGASVASAIEILNDYAPVFAIAFAVALLVTPIMRRVAHRFGIVDRPDSKRKLHAQTVAYLGGVAIAVAILAGLAFAYLGQAVSTPGAEHYSMVPIAVVVGMIAIVATGLADDIFHWDPRLKIAGQLVAAAALVMASIGDDAALGMLSWLRFLSPEALSWMRETRILQMSLVGWIGVIVVAMFVLGGCNAANFLDGMDGLLTGVTAITAAGLLVISIVLIPFDDREIWDDQAQAAGVQTELQRMAADHRLQHGQAPELSLVKEWAEPKDLPPGWVLGYQEGVGRVAVRDQREVTAQAVEAALSEMLVQSDGDIRPLSVAVAGARLDEDTEIPPTHPLPAGYEVVIDGTTWPDVSLSVERKRSFGIARVVLCLALLGAVLGFLPHNFRPATIFLGDCGSLLLGYMCVVIILMMGDGGHSHLMFAGLIVFAVPIMDTILAIVRRKLAGVPVSVADNHHLHHQLQRTLGSVPRAVLALYGISAFFALVGVVLATGYVAFENRGVRLIYVIAGVLFSFVTVIAIKAARREQWRRQVAEAAAKSTELGDDSE